MLARRLLKRRLMSSLVSSRASAPSRSSVGRLALVPGVKLTTRITPDGAHIANPAFDVTPARYITAIVTEAGIAYPPFADSLPRMVAQARQNHQERRMMQA